MALETNAPKIQDYVDAGGLRTYYEVEGSGEPLVLLHGGFCPIETFGGLTPLLAERYRVYLPERRARAHARRRRAHHLRADGARYDLVHGRGGTALGSPRGV
jgi:pimeloyl-ACP methyl ester carboxylesterase